MTREQAQLELLRRIHVKPLVQPLEERAPHNPPSGPACVPQLVQQWALSTPAAPAVISGAETITYRQLNQAASALGQRLRQAGVGPDQLVGIYMNRSPESVISALATFLAGGAYLPLDPALPPERHAFMLAEANVAAVVTNSNLAGNLEGAWPVLVYDAGDRTVAMEATEDLKVDVHPEDLAYVIFTSGSTGQPKGVEVTHANLANLVEWHIEAFNVRTADRASAQAAVGFDAAVWEIWPYLAAGASVTIPDESIRNQPKALRDWLIDNGITITFLPTAMAEQMLLLDWPAQTALRILLTGADALRRRPNPQTPFQLVNNYGPTECAVVATSGLVHPDPSAVDLPSIGRPIRHTEIRILDHNMNPVADGGSGEIYIGGAGVARRYRNNPELTAERFVPNPFPALNGNGNRLYRTGDVGRFRANGEIEFLGRLDEQLKIRGFRVEPGEIVTRINSHSGVQASAVTLLGKEGDERKLVAYVVVKPGAALTRESLRQWLSEWLPEYMLPAVFVKIESLPLTANGKLDYRALPAPAASNLLPETDFVAPRTLVEQRLAAILSPLLRVEQVSVKDNFFLLGGHSLLGTQLLTKIREAFGVDLSLLSLFDHPTLEEMSLEVENLILAKVVNGTGADGSAESQLMPERRQ